MKPPDITVVIPVYGLPEMTLECIRSVQLGAPPHRIIVVDDASPDGTGEWLRAQAPEVDVVTLEQNVGYGRAVNRGVALATSPVVVILNNDTIVEPGFVAAICAPLFNGPDDLASVAAVVLRPNGATIGAAGLTVDETLASYTRLTGKPPTDAGEIWPPLAGPDGTAAAYRVEAWRRCGGFDERIPAYYEDTDLCLRIHRSGWRTTVAPDAQVRHLGGQTYGRQPRRVMRLAAFGRGYLMRRHRHLLRGTGAAAMVQEAVIGTLSSARHRSLLPLTGRIAGWRAATPLPPSERRPPMITGVIARLRYRRWHDRAHRN